MGATKPEMHVEVCSACHPFYTGKDKVLDAAGRVEKFKKRLAQKKKMQMFQFEIEMSVWQK